MKNILNMMPQSRSSELQDQFDIIQINNYQQRQDARMSSPGFAQSNRYAKQLINNSNYGVFNMSSGECREQYAFIDNSPRASPSNFFSQLRSHSKISAKTVDLNFKPIDTLLNPPSSPIRVSAFQQQSDQIFCQSRPNYRIGVPGQIDSQLRKSDFFVASRPQINPVFMQKHKSKTLNQTLEKFNPTGKANYSHEPVFRSVAKSQVSVQKQQVIHNFIPQFANLLRVSAIKK